MPTIDMEATGKNIKIVMDRAGKTAKDMRDACGFTTCNAIYKWLNGTSLPTIDNLVIIAFVCGTTMDEIVVLR